MRKVVSQFGDGPLQQKLSAGDLHFLSDAYPASGGNGTGPTPHEYLGAALAACTSMTLKMYAGRKSINLENAIVTVDIERLNDVTAKPSMEGDIICAVSYQGRIGCGQARTGNLLWFKDYSSYTGTSQSTEMVFSANEKSHVTAFATKDGTQVWENTQLTFRDLGESLAVGKVLLMGDAQGYVHALAQANGEMVARIRHDSNPISAAPIAVGGLILIQSQGGKITAYSPK